ncbi:MAG: hypothetical protein OXG15_02285 [Gammaproteobacteria bacterium]|nr:hypothetical protein [Gammaproteobacteria bacterium]
MKPDLKIVENDPPETDYKDGDGVGGGNPPRQSNYAYFGLDFTPLVPLLLGCALIVGAGWWLFATFGGATLLGIALLVSPVLPWLHPSGWWVALAIWWFAIMYAIA